MTVVVRDAFSESENARRVDEGVGWSSRLGRQRDILTIQRCYRSARLILERKDLVQIAEAGVKEQIVEGTRPLPLQDIGGFDLTPGRISADEGVGGIATEEPILFVVPPHKVQMIVLGKLIVAAKRNVALMVRVGSWRAVRIG